MISILPLIGLFPVLFILVFGVISKIPGGSALNSCKGIMITTGMIISRLQLNTFDFAKSSFSIGAAKLIWRFVY